MTKNQYKCADCGRTDVVLLRAEAEGLEPLWLCLACANRRVNSPENIEINSAIEELDEHQDGGGKLS
jgi:hypothetical protein